MRKPIGRDTGARTLFLARLIGLYLLVVGLTMLVNKDLMVAAVNAFPHDPEAWALAGVLALGAGLGIVLTHNVWSGGALPVIVTLAGWAALIKGVVLLGWPFASGPAYITSLHFAEFFYEYAVFVVLLGAYLTYSGFTRRRFSP